MKRLDREPTLVELASALEMEAAELQSFLEMAQPPQVISFDDDGEFGMCEDGVGLAERLADVMAPRPDASLLLTENRKNLAECLRRLPEAQVIVITLHYLDDVPLRQIARMLAVTPSRISQLHHQALARLKQSLERAHKKR